MGTVAFHVAWLLSTKWILSSGTGYGFMFPKCLSSWHIGICLLSTLWILRSDNALAELQAYWKRQWKGMLAVGALLALDMMFQYSSLVNQSLTMNQIVRCVSVHAASASCPWQQRTEFIFLGQQEVCYL